MARVPASTDTGAFWISTTEVTWDAFDVMLFRLDEPEAMRGEPEESGEGGHDADAFARPSKPYVAVDRGFGHNGYPALSMSLRGADAFCAWLSAKTGRRYRLPTEAEWEHAALAGSTGPWCFGDDEAELARFAWHAANAERKTHPVGELAPNAWGLHDVHGNVGEWCTTVDEEGRRRGVLRGGSYQDEPERVRADAVKRPRASWNASDPNVPKSPWWLADGPFVGMRVVCDDEPPQPERDR